MDGGLESRKDDQAAAGIVDILALIHRRAAQGEA